MPEHGDGLAEERVEELSVQGAEDPVTSTEMAVYFGRGLQFRCTLRLPALNNLPEELQGKELLLAIGTGTSKKEAIAVACLDAISKLYLNRILDDNLVIYGRCRPARNRPLFGHWLKKKDLTPVNNYLRELPTCFTDGSKIFYETDNEGDANEENTKATPELIDAYLYSFELQSHDTSEACRIGPIGILLPKEMPPWYLEQAVVPALPAHLPELSRIEGTSRLRFRKKLQLKKSSLFRLKKFQLALFDLLRMRGKPLGCSFDEVAFANFFDPEKYSSPCVKPTAKPPPSEGGADAELLPDLSLGPSAALDGSNVAKSSGNVDAKDANKNNDVNTTAEQKEKTTIGSEANATEGKTQDADKEGKEGNKEFVIDWSIQKNWLCVPITQAGIEWTSVDRAIETEKGGVPLRKVIRRLKEDGTDEIPSDVVVHKYTNPFMFYVSVGFTTKEEIAQLAKEDEAIQEDDESANPQVVYVILCAFVLF